MVSLLVLFAIPFIGWNLRRAYNLYRNYLAARKLGIPIIVLPIGWQDDLWLLTWYFFKWIKYLPNFLSWWFDYSRYAWTQELRHRPHEKYGDVFVLVAPGGNEIVLNDPQASFEVQARYKQWLKPEPLYELFNTFGKGVIAVNGDDWQRQRRIINPAFRESVHKLVWEESRKQARQMLESRTKQHASRGTLDEVRKDCVLIALHVLSSAGFGHTHDFSGGLRQVPEGHTTSFSEALMYLLSNILHVYLFSEIKPLAWIRPWKAQEIKTTVAEFREYMKETVAYSRATTQGGGGGQANDIVGALVDADEAAKREEKIAPNSGFGGKPIHLTDDELFGNLYVFNLAGFETTANALTYTMPFLARQPDIQEWVAEEIDAVIKTGSEQEWTYETAFPALVRCLAVMVSRKISKAESSIDIVIV
jgi:cytochrome P450